MRSLSYVFLIGDTGFCDENTAKLQFMQKKKPFMQKEIVFDIPVLQCNHKKKAGFDYEFEIRINYQQDDA